MRRIRILGLALFALLALGAFAASVASAEEGVLPDQAGKAFTIKGGVATLETLINGTVQDPGIECKEVTGKGLFLNAKEKDQHATGDLDFTGCKVPSLGLGMQSLGDAKEVILSKVLFLICLVEPKQLVFGLLIQPIETEHIEVPTVKQLLLRKGALIGENLSGNIGQAFTIDLEGKGGDQTKALECEINGKKFKHTFEAANDSESKKDVMASENATAVVTFAQKVELMDT